MVVTFSVMVALPLAVTAIYAMVIASPYYITEARLAVREATDRPLVDTYLGASTFESLPSPTADREKEATAGTSGASQSSRAASIVSSVMQALSGGQDAIEAFVVADFIKSQEIVNKLNRDNWLRARFAGGDPDWFQALPYDASHEVLSNYWRTNVVASVDITTNLIGLSVKAFTPEDSVAIAQRVVTECNALLSRLMERARHDRMADSKGLVARAQERYIAAQSALRNLRTDEYFIDPTMVASDSFTQLMQLISARISMDVQLRMMEPNLAPDAPQLKVLRTRLAALDAEIARTKSALTDPRGSDKAAANYLAVYEELETERALSLAFYQSALDTLERVRLSTERQAFYLAVFVPPEPPDHAAGPDTVRSVRLVGLVTMLMWGVVMVVAAASRDQARSSA